MGASKFLEHIPPFEPTAAMIAEVNMAEWLERAAAGRPPGRAEVEEVLGFWLPSDWVGKVVDRFMLVMEKLGR